MTWIRPVIRVAWHGPAAGIAPAEHVVDEPEVHRSCGLVTEQDFQALWMVSDDGFRDARSW